MNSAGPPTFLDALLELQGDSQLQTLRLWEHLLQFPRVVRPPTRISTTPYEVVLENNVFRLLRYQAKPARQSAEPVLICFALVNRPYVLDLPNGRSVVQRLLERGIDVWLIDWVAPTDANHGRCLADYVCGSMHEAVEATLQRAEVTQLNLLGYCMGGTMATIYTALFPQQVRNLILMAPPIDFHADDGLLNRWTQVDYFDVDQFVDVYGNCPGWFLQSCFQLMKPVQNYIEKYLNLHERIDSDASLENFLAMERWANDSIPIAGETFRDFVKLLYQQNQLTEGKLELRGVKVRLGSIQCPVLLLTADRDHLVSPRSSKALEQHVRSAEFESLSIDAGHIGLAVSARSHRELWPPASEWIAAHSTEVT
ncbi:alpha/beta fold hydrolase [Aeoliella sp. ICT_H6.2]|uniref:Alpha/beta fold hydrolase n=1 Tax=Aeoliella straminimaris TaxID=2954799 RepID=A0A9X2JEQ1_9BACT|nr:alpha/beta fold hydrolase [Aeoliella straminimaris]MCO6043240.1 alpha/beta fold hydrolase [Aeoliella straminimaris]